MEERIIRVATDLRNLEEFYNITVSPARREKLNEYLSSEAKALQAVNFDELVGEEQVDYHLLKKLLGRKIAQIRLDQERNDKMIPVLPFASQIIGLCEARQNMLPLDARDSANTLHFISESARETRGTIERGDMATKIDKNSGLRASQTVEEFARHLAEFYSYQASYDPMFDWWVRTPWEEANMALNQLIPVIQMKLAGMKPNEEDEIIGERIGEEGLKSELRAELIPYSPSELIRLAEKEYAWCEVEMKKASRELGYTDDWKKALDYVKEQYAEPGKQTHLVRNLAEEAIEYVNRHDLITVPEIAASTWRMFMLSPAQQKISPFFLGGPSILVSSPTADMPHTDKLMVVRSNNKHFSKATVFHELIPGHRLQLFMADRYKVYRQVFYTSFYVEGWAMYWELVLWERGDFFASPEDRIGTLFWRMHRCARIIFSLKFHLGEMSPQQCVDLLVDWVGHERSTAEGEVRRSLRSGTTDSYGPLYQAGYMLGALQFWALRKEALGRGGMKEKEFHDRVLKANMMPIELLRALILKQDLDEDFETKWRFYGDLS